jgi:hypothetical protein
MKIISPKYSYVFLMIVVLAATLVRPAPKAQAAAAGTEAINFWNSIMLRSVVTVGQQSPPVSFVYASYVQAAVYNALVAIEGGYQPYKSTLAPKPNASVEAAVATSAHDVLVHYFPAQQSALDADYAGFMASIGDGTAKTEGIQVGTAAAAELIELRQNDGLYPPNFSFTMPTPAPGIWQLPTGANPLSPWLGQMQPFMLDSADQFRPGPPPALSSDEWARDYNETKLYGRSDSPVRTPEQTAIARFWRVPPAVQYNLAYQQIATLKDLSALQTARLMVMGNMVAADAEIACFEAKYLYLFWRPSFAIPLGDTDGNPDTIGDPTWTPLLTTPAHPDYPSSHNCATVSVAEVFAEFLGTQHFNVDIPSTVAGVEPRHFRDANDLTQEIINARVWAGLHFRVADVAGASLGRKVAHWTLKRYFLPAN